MASLTLAEAEHILAAAKAKVIVLGAKMSVSVVDPRGDLITMCRTGCYRAGGACRGVGRRGRRWGTLGAPGGARPRRRGKNAVCFSYPRGIQRAEAEVAVRRERAHAELSYPPWPRPVPLLTAPT